MAACVLINTDQLWPPPCCFSFQPINSLLVISSQELIKAHFDDCRTKNEDNLPLTQTWAYLAEFTGERAVEMVVVGEGEAARGRFRRWLPSPPPSCSHDRGAGGKCLCGLLYKLCKIKRLVPHRLQLFIFNIFFCFFFNKRERGMKQRELSNRNNANMPSCGDASYLLLTRCAYSVVYDRSPPPPKKNK